MSTTFLSDVFSRSLSLLRRDAGSPGIVDPNPAAHGYTLDLQRDEVALGRFVKRLSASGVENIRVEYPTDEVVRIKLDRSMGEDARESEISELVNRCGLSYAA